MAVWHRKYSAADRIGISGWAKAVFSSWSRLHRELAAQQGIADRSAIRVTAAWLQRFWLQWVQQQAKREQCLGDHENAVSHWQRLQLGNTLRRLADLNRFDTALADREENAAKSLHSTYLQQWRDWVRKKHV